MTSSNSAASVQFKLLGPEGSSNGGSEYSSLEDLRVPGRYDVFFSYEMHCCKEVTEGIRMRLEMTFRYDESIIETALSSQRPIGKYEKQYGGAHRLFPYCIHNCIQEDRISWTYQEDNDGTVHERIDIMATLTKVAFSRYFPLVLSVICLKMGTDGTGQTGKINLLVDHTTPDVGCFTKETSEFSLSKFDLEAFTMKTYVRDLRKEALASAPGIYTRVYATMFFNGESMQNRLRFLALPLVMLNSTSLVGLETDAGTCSQTGLAIAFLTASLLFSLPSSEMTTSTIIVVCHCMYEMLVSSLITVEVWLNGWSMRVLWSTIACNVVATLATLVFAWKEARSFVELVNQTEKSVRGQDGSIASFDSVDQIF